VISNDHEFLDNITPLVVRLRKDFSDLDDTWSRNLREFECLFQSDVCRQWLRRIKQELDDLHDPRRVLEGIFEDCQRAYETVSEASTLRTSLTLPPSFTLESWLILWWIFRLGGRSVNVPKSRRE
jgi:hypothetical protein